MVLSVPRACELSVTRGLKHRLCHHKCDKGKHDSQTAFAAWQSSLNYQLDFAIETYGKAQTFPFNVDKSPPR